MSYIVTSHFFKFHILDILQAMDLNRRILQLPMQRESLPLGDCLTTIMSIKVRFLVSGGDMDRFNYFPHL